MDRTSTLTSSKWSKWTISDRNLESNPIASAHVFIQVHLSHSIQVSPLTRPRTFYDLCRWVCFGFDIRSLDLINWSILSTVSFSSLGPSNDRLPLKAICSADTRLTHSALCHPQDRVCRIHHHQLWGRVFTNENLASFPSTDPSTFTSVYRTFMSAPPFFFIIPRIPYDSLGVIYLNFDPLNPVFFQRVKRLEDVSDVWIILPLLITYT